MKEEKIIKFFAENGFGMENGCFIGTNNYAFLPFNGSLIVGKNTKRGLLVEGIFKDTWIRKLLYDPKRGEVLIDVRDDVKVPLKDPTKPLEAT